jgi:sugar phosphate permease
LDIHLTGTRQISPHISPVSRLWLVKSDSLPTSIVLVGGLPIQSLSMRRIVFMLTLILAGELIFGLPYHTTRFFRPTFLQAFELSNTQLGDMFAVYGITAMLAYFPGGVIADHYSPRSLMTLSLFATAAGGLYMATFPGHLQLALLYGFWGVSTILLFWSAMISATREWGGKHSQGNAFGILDGKLCK